MVIGGDRCLRLPSRLTQNALSFDETVYFWRLIDGRKNDKKIILTALIHRNIINMLPSYKPTRLDGVRVSSERLTAYFKPSIKGEFLCVNKDESEEFLSAEMIGLIATIKAFKTYSDKHNDIELRQFIAYILEDISYEFRGYTCEIRKEFLSTSDRAINVRKLHRVLKRWIK